MFKEPDRVWSKDINSKDAVEEAMEEVDLGIKIGLDLIETGEEVVVVLFEKDFLFRNRPEDKQEVMLGNGSTIEYPMLFRRFISSIASKGKIVSTELESDFGKLKGETPNSLHFSTYYPNADFPVERSTYSFISNAGVGMLITLEKFYWADQATPKTPLTLSFIAERNDAIIAPNIVDKTKVPVLA